MKFKSTPTFIPKYGVHSHRMFHHITFTPPSSGYELPENKNSDFSTWAISPLGSQWVGYTSWFVRVSPSSFLLFQCPTSTTFHSQIHLESWIINEFRETQACAIIILFIPLFLAVLGLHCCLQAFSSCGEGWCFLVAVHRIHIVMDSLVVEHRL